VATVVSRADEARAEIHWRELHRRLCADHPAFLLDFVSCVDAKTGERFKFDLLTAAEREHLLGEDDRLYQRFSVEREPGKWHWQRESLLDEWIRWDRWIGLKARQIGVTWLAAGLTLWALLFLPGTRCLIVSTNEDEAKKVIARIWGMFQSVPDYLREHVVQTIPKRFASEPSQEIEVRHPDGRKSAILALPSTKKAGHGETARIVVLDEGAYQDYLRDTWKGTFPTIDGGGQILVISTGNGVSNALTGEGNFFHYLWTNGDSLGLKKRFLRWDLHPSRDEEWYQNNAAALPPIERAQQYPRDPQDAFLSTQPCWFDLDKLGWYAREAMLEPIKRLRFVRDPQNRKRMVGQEHDFGEVRVFARPDKERRYAIGADVATGRGTDFSAAYVIDLAEMAFAAEFHAKIAPDLFAEQLWAMGRWYNDAVIAIELGGGYGDSVVVPLRDGITGLKPYPKLYRHSSEIRLERQVNATFGFPMTNRTRPQVINQLEQVIRDKEVPALPPGLIDECRTFISMPTPPTPRAQDGSNDDRVMAAGIALEMYRRYGHHEHRLYRNMTVKPATKRWVGIN
jgi:hypothetical protein